jgi:hypothetical protein
MRGDSMSKKYYYTCPIKALYMMKEFGLFIYDKNKALFICYEPEFSLSKLLKVIEKLGKIYVPKELEHIFEPKKGDEGRWLRPIGAHYANHNGEQWVSAGIEPNPPEIIMRDNKQFFMPEVEQ